MLRIRSSFFGFVPSNVVLVVVVGRGVEWTGNGGARLAS